MDYNPGEEIPLMLWKDSLHRRVREFCRILEGTRYSPIVAQLDELKENLNFSADAIALVDWLSPTGLYDRNYLELEAELGRYWSVHPEDNTISLVKITEREIEKDMLEAVSLLVAYLVLNSD